MTLNIQGQKFGRLLALGSVGSVKKKVVWRFLCDCGKEVELAATFVKRLHTQSCGCLREDQLRDAISVDITGRRFGMVVAVKKQPSAGGRVQWLCQCDCGASVVRPSKNLLNGSAVSCGCRQTAANKETPLSPLKRRSQMSAYAHQRRMKERQAGGNYTADQIDDMYRKQRGKCAWCGVSLADGFHRDHRVPISKGGDNSIANISLTCGPCNLKKRAKDEIVWAQQNGKLC